MLAVVYRCKWQGQRLDREAIQASPKRGNLIVRRRGFYHRIALLLAPDGESNVVPVLDKVKLLAVDDRGMLLSGIEMHPAARRQGPRCVFRANVVVRAQGRAGARRAHA